MVAALPRRTAPTLTKPKELNSEFESENELLRNNNNFIAGNSRKNADFYDAYGTTTYDDLTEDTDSSVYYQDYVKAEKNYVDKINKRDHKDKYGRSRRTEKQRPVRKNKSNNRTRTISSSDSDWGYKNDFIMAPLKDRKNFSKNNRYFRSKSDSRKKSAERMENLIDEYDKLRLNAYYDNFAVEKPKNQSRNNSRTRKYNPILDGDYTRKRRFSRNRNFY